MHERLVKFYWNTSLLAVEQEYFITIILHNYKADMIKFGDEVAFGQQHLLR